jgi:hypothetical protein
MDTDVSSARGYSSDVEDGLRLAADDSDADDTAAVPWPQLPLPDLGSNDVLAGSGSFQPAADAAGSTALPAAVAASPAALMDTSHTNSAAARGFQTADVPVAAADARSRLGSSRGLGVKSGPPALQPFSGQVAEARPSGLNPVELAALQRQQEAAGSSADAAGSRQAAEAAAWLRAQDAEAALLVESDAWQDADQGLGPLPCGIDDVSLSAAAAADRPDAWGLETWA